MGDAVLVVVIGTGGTIAGTATRTQDHVGYTAGLLAPDDLIAAVPALAGVALQTLALAQVDSCDMDHATWVRLAQAVRAQLARPEVAGVVVTHGTDTLEETACFLHHTVRADKPVVLTAAMRPATAPSPDGPQNLLDAVTVARSPGVRGVLAVLGGVVHAATDLRKVHGYRVDAFSSGDAGPLARLEDGQLRRYRDWPARPPAHTAVLALDTSGWPVVDIVTSHAGARGQTIDALVAAGSQGIVLAGTGNGSVHASLLAAARRAVECGVPVRRASRCILGGVVGQAADALPSAGSATPAQARVQLLLDLLAARGCAAPLGAVMPAAIAAGYDAVAAEYAQRLSRELDDKPFDRAFLDGVAALVPGGSVLDIGCGPGHVGRYLQDRGLSATGLDISQRMVSLAAQLNPGLQFQQGDMRRLGFADASFDAVVAFYSIIHLQARELVAAFAEMRRVLRSGGALALAFHLGSHVQHVGELWGVPTNIDFVFFETEPVLVALKEAGFDVLEVTTRLPYPPPVEAQTERCYVRARRPAGG